MGWERLIAVQTICGCWALGSWVQSWLAFRAERCRVGLPSVDELTEVHPDGLSGHFLNFQRDS